MKPEPSNNRSKISKNFTKSESSQVKIKKLVTRQDISEGLIYS